MTTMMSLFAQLELSMISRRTKEALASDELDVVVSQDVTRAQMCGLTGVPALVFEQKYLVSGAQPYEALVGVVEQIGAESG